MIPPLPSLTTRWRWLRLVAAGGFLFVLKVATMPVPPGEAGAGQAITIDATTLAQLDGDFRRREGREPNSTDEEGLIRHYADEEMLYRHALWLGLDRSNFAVRRRLVSSMGFLSEVTEGDSSSEIPKTSDDALYDRALKLGLDKTDPVLRRMLIENMLVAFRYSALDLAPGDDVLERFIEGHPDDFTAPARITFVHVFFSSAKRGPAIEHDAAAALARLRGSDDRDAARLGDAFAEGSEFRRRSVDSLTRIFGPTFPLAVERLTAGVWSAPIASEHGLHLVRVDKLEPARLLELDEVRGQALARWRADRGEQRMNEAIAELRGSYSVHVERSARDATARSIQVGSADGPRPPA